jgi:hypothetical protein
MNGFWTSGPDRYTKGLNAEHQRRRAELLASIQSAGTDEERDRLTVELKSLDGDYAERHSKIRRSLF